MLYFINIMVLGKHSIFIYSKKRYFRERNETKYFFTMQIKYGFYQQIRLNEKKYTVLFAISNNISIFASN